MNAPSLPLAPACEPIDADRRFGGIARLYGPHGLARLREAHVAIVGVGGVGSWVAEACVRSAVGAITLIDLDHVSESNINRQIHALDATVGAAKVQVMADRIRAIDPGCTVTAVEDFVDAGNVATLLPAGRFDLVVDAVDDVRAKIALVDHCRNAGLRAITVGGAGGRTDPTRVRVADFAHTFNDAMLAKVRKALRQKHGWPRDTAQPFGVTAVFSDEPEGEREGLSGLNCAGYGSTVAVTAVFGFVAAGQVVEKIARG